MTLGKRIVEYRKQIRCSQKTLAERLEIMPSTLGKYESGRSIPGGGFLQKLALSTDIDMNWLLTGQGSMLITDTLTGPDSIYEYTTLLQVIRQQAKIIANLACPASLAASICEELGDTAPSESDES